ncbi:hypothetical protein PQR62_10950 [Herbaspirillum lusitanum]|uniref:Uncharacterized protein n=1 Tax=Herbaspirillum lusitanum TaxID=213312 RepID=A0ABW9AA90_9BURK
MAKGFAGATSISFRGILSFCHLHLSRTERVLRAPVCARSGLIARGRLRTKRSIKRAVSDKASKTGSQNNRKKAAAGQQEQFRAQERRAGWNAA